MKFEKVLSKELGNTFKNSLKMAYISTDSGGYISKNENLFNFITLNSINKFVLKKALLGTAIYKFGDFDEKIALISGIHGNELPPQIASLLLFEELLNVNLKCCVYLIPFASPFASMNNTRRFDSKDLNRSAFIEGSLSNEILNGIGTLNVKAIADFHATARNSNPGNESIFCSRVPTGESFKIAQHISNKSGSELIENEKAGFPFDGAIEDESNLRGIPAITCEVVSPFGNIKIGSVERSFIQMKSFLSYFSI